ncbi:MAG: DUF4190 domain-containing protein [Chloroflexota bacterium]
MTMTQTSTMAIVSLVSGIISWFALPLIGAVVAVITGHMAKKEIRSSMGRLTGEGMATVGLVLGYLQLGLTVLGVCATIVAVVVFGASLPLCFPFTNSITY